MHLDIPTKIQFLYTQLQIKESETSTNHLFKILMAFDNLSKNLGHNSYRLRIQKRMLRT